jgi:molybdopterin/thiamine biosynthesis adenylyltransferase
MTDDIDQALVAHLIRDDQQEDIIFAVYQPSTGATRSTALLVDLVHPVEGERSVHGNAAFTGAYILRAAGLAAERGLGLALLHSHPRGIGWQGLSRDDRVAESGHATAAQVLTGLPLVGLTLAGGDRTYSARRWHRGAGERGTAASGQADWVDEQAITVRVVGTQIRANFNDQLIPVPGRTRRTIRTVQSWGHMAHDNLVRLRVGVVGAGSVAQPVAESLIRIGFVHVDLLDFDLIEEHNLDRLLHATEADIGHMKVDVLVEELRRRAVTPNAEVHGFTDSLVEPGGWRRALDCDILFSCVDRPWPRFALNIAAYAHLIPVVDGGVAVDVHADNDTQDKATPTSVRLLGAEWRAHVVGPNRKCLECLGQYDPSDVGMDRAGLLDKPSYIASLPSSHRFRRRENVFAFSMACAAAEILELLRAVLGPSRIFDIGATLTHWTTGTTDRDLGECRPTCPFSHQLLGRGDAVGIDVTERHLAAEASRSKAAAYDERRT